MKRHRFAMLLGFMCLTSLLLAGAARAGIEVGSDGSDGTLTVTRAISIDLSQAANAPWNTPSPVPGKGVYDAQKWAVVFKYDSIYVAPGASLDIYNTDNNSINAPIVWLVSRGVEIHGPVSVYAQAGTVSGIPTPPGYGGFRGGAGGAGMGPGGGGYPGKGGGYGTVGGGVGGGVVYGNPQILPLIGGSGGGAGSDGRSGGGGGGALLIAAGQTLAIEGAISVRGGEGNGSGGGGSGGAIRIVADTIVGTGLLDVTGGLGGSSGGVGRVRLEANTIAFAGRISGTSSLYSPVGPAATIWPPSGSPGISIATVSGQPVPAEPNGNLILGDVQISSATSVLVTISAVSVPSNATMTLRAVLVLGGTAVSVPATFTSGSQAASTWTATLPSIANNRYAVLQARVTLP